MCVTASQQPNGKRPLFIKLSRRQPANLSWMTAVNFQVRNSAYSRGPASVGTWVLTEANISSSLSSVGTQITCTSSGGSNSGRYPTSVRDGLQKFFRHHSEAFRMPRHSNDCRWLHTACIPVGNIPDCIP
jgi:hypothetical protein